MGAVAGALFAELSTGDHAIFTKAKYSGTEDITSDYFKRFKIKLDTFDSQDPDDIIADLKQALGD